MKKRILAMLVAAMLLVMSAAPAMAAAPKIRKTDYEGNGVVEVDFKTENVRYKGAKVVVKDANGKKLAAKILEKDDDDLTFKVTGLKANGKYTYTISGVRAGRTGSYGKVSGTFKTPSSGPSIKKVKYDREDRELEIEFATKVQFNGLKVTVKDAKGKALSVRWIEKGDDDLELKLSGVQRGKTYTVTVSGVRVRGKGNFVSVSKTFTA